MNWLCVKTTDVLDGIKTGKKDVNQASTQGKYPFFSCARETSLYSDNAFLDKDAIIIAGNGAYTGYVKKIQGPFDLYQRTYALYDFKKEVDWRYIYFVFKFFFEGRYMGGTSGAAIPYITKPVIENFSFNIPCHKAVQKKVADILWAYDDLLVNNQRRIALLEESARLLYREWFVYMRSPVCQKEKTINCVPNGWKAVSLGDFVEVKKGKNITKDKSENGKIPVVAGGLAPAYFHNKYNVIAPVITVSASGNAGYVNLYLSNIWASDCSYISVAETSEIWFLFCLMKANQKKIMAMQQGVAIPHVYPKHLKRMEIILPPVKLRQDFHNRVDAIFLQIANLTKQNEQLSKARDLLLPRLMDGRIKL